MTRARKCHDGPPADHTAIREPPLTPAEASHGLDIPSAVVLCHSADIYAKIHGKADVFDQPPSTTKGKEVRQGDTVSPNLITTVLQWIMKSLDYGKKVIRRV
uniref:Reverse transcriptase domain-containing protein n=1 Tax=Angiostrongylus cantonensis TaxID=6313 RepID=A0A0K0CZ78_ANGCA